MKIIKKVRAPVRIDFGGGTTDIYPFTKFGGSVLNAAINRYITGKLVATGNRVGLKYSGNIPTSSGLGTSGVMNLVWLSLISDTKNRIQLAEKVYSLEQSLGQIGGRQDQYASAMGGINFFEFKNHNVKITRLKLKRELIKELERNLVLVYIGRHPRESNRLMINNFLKGKTKDNLIKIRNLAREMKSSLVKGDLGEFSYLMNKETEQRQKLHRSIFNPRIKGLIKKGKNAGALSAKICGAGGGGSLLFYTENRKKLSREFRGKIINFKFDFQGLKWL